MPRFKPSSLYMRESVRQAMNRMWTVPLTVVEAPMGYGKTTAVREYLRTTDACVLWQSVQDNLPNSFWKGFSRLFEGTSEGCARSLLKLGLPGDGALREEALRLIANAGLPAGTVLVIDDYHLAEAPEADRFVAFLAQRAIPGLHVVLITRFSWLQNLEELKLKGYLHHITKEYFELAPREIAEYYRACGVSLKAGEADKLYALTEGWISALYLFMLEFIAKGSYTPENNIYKLVEKSIYEPLSAEIKEFLLTMCIFDSFTLEQAVYMWGKENAGELLTEITGKNAFVNYDGRSKTYYAHNIFTGFLKDALAPKDARHKNDLYQRAAGWFRRTGDYFAARRYYYECRDFDGLLFALEEDKSNDFTAENNELLKKYMTECPHEVKARHHYATLIYAMHLFVHNERELFRKTCKEFSENMEMDESLDPEVRNRLLGELELLLSFAEFNDLKKMSARHQKAWELLNQPTAIYDTGTNWTFGSPSVLTLYYRESGKLAEHIRDLKAGMPYYYRLTNGHGSGAEYAMEAEARFNQGDFENAEISAHKALIKAQAGMDENLVFSARYLMILISFMKGDLSQVMEIMRKMREDIAKGKENDFVHTVEICEGSIYAYLDQKDKIPERLWGDDAGNIRLRFPALPFFNVMYGRVLLIKGEYLKLIGSEDHFIRIASVFQNQLGLVYTHIYLAAAYYKLFREDEALSSLKKALRIAMPDRQFMLFTENCDYIEPLLDKIAAEGCYRGEIGEIQRLYRIFRESKERMIREYLAAEKPHLTDREIEIARLAAAGITNREIGARLFISENTVKTLLKSVFGKLGINSRALLAARLEELD